MHIKESINNLSPLRYPGSKKKISKYIYKILKFNNTDSYILVEPFVGGGSVFLYFLLKHDVEKVIIADKDRLIYSFWKVLFSDPDYLIRFVKKVKINLNNFYKYKKIANHHDYYSIKKLAETCLFLNRTSFSGILTDQVGPLGGKKQKSIYKINCRFKRKLLGEKIRRISKFKEKVIVLDGDYKKTIKYVTRLQFKEKKLKKIFFYLDPPFFNKANDLYRCYFTKKEHKKFRNNILLKNNWILSYDNAPEIKEMYSGFEKINIEVPYSINSPAKRIEKELIITTLKLPNKRFLIKD